MVKYLRESIVEALRCIGPLSPFDLKGVLDEPELPLACVAYHVTVLVRDEVVARCRKRAGIFQEELSTRTGLHRTEIGMLERGARLAQLNTLIKLAGGLEVEPSELLEGLSWRPGRVRPGRFKNRPSLSGPRRRCRSSRHFWSSSPSPGRCRANRRRRCGSRNRPRRSSSCCDRLRDRGWRDPLARAAGELDPQPDDGRDPARGRDICPHRSRRQPRPRRHSSPARWPPAWLQS